MASKPVNGKLPRRGGGVPDARAYAFAKFVVIHRGNNRAAYMAAFPDAPVDNVSIAAARLASRPKIKAIVREMLANQYADLPMTEREVTRGYERVAKADIRQVLDAKGKLLPVELWPEDFCAAVQAVRFSRETGAVTAVQLAPRVPALDGLARMLNLFAADGLSRDTGNLLAGLPRDVVLKLRERLAKLARAPESELSPRLIEAESEPANTIGSTVVPKNTGFDDTEHNM